MNSAYKEREKVLTVLKGHQNKTKKERHLNTNNEHNKDKVVKNIRMPTRNEEGGGRGWVS